MKNEITKIPKNSFAKQCTANTSPNDTNFDIQHLEENMHDRKKNKLFSIFYLVTTTTYVTFTAIHIVPLHVSFHYVRMLGYEITLGTYALWMTCLFAEST
jgi:hypothetical protein